MYPNKRKKKDVVTASEQYQTDTTGNIVLGDEKDMQNDVNICEHDSNTLQQNTELHGIGNVILKDRQKNLCNL